MSNSTPLLVPVEVQAMVLNNAAANFVRAQMNYDNLKSCQSPSPAPFQQDQVNFASNLDNHGVYLRWVLPQAHRHAESSPAGALSFRFVPNRWLVVRVYRPAATADAAVAPQATAWVVESDCLNSLSGAHYIDPTEPSQVTPIQIGRMVPVTPGTSWQEPASRPPYFLRAVAESNPAFAAYQPFNQNVFSIHDALQTQSIGKGTLSYFVLGWYSDPNADILAGWQPGPQGSGFSEWLTKLRWSASPRAEGTVSSLYHGSAFGVQWEPRSVPPSSPKDDARPQIAVGNTSVDAVVAFAEAAFSDPKVARTDNLTPAQAADLLEAFQYNLIPLLDQPGCEEQLEQAIRSHWFGSTSAGTSWTIVDAPVAPGSPPSPPRDPNELAREAAGEAAWLAALNAAQSKLDLTVRNLMGVQRQLFELWWKQRAMEAVFAQTGRPPWNVTREQFAAVLNSTDQEGLIETAGRYLAEIARLSAEVPTATAQDSLADKITAFAEAKRLSPTRTLKALAPPRFWTAMDPVMVLSGTAHLMKIDPDSTLACRWPSELVTSLKVSATAGGPTFSVSSAALAKLQPSVDFTNLPASAAALFAEFFLLDPANAALVGFVAGKKLASAEIAAVATSMAAPSPAAGTAPGILASFPWRQPWQPLYLDWEIDWYPIPFLNEHGVPNWAFNGTDYDLQPGVTKPDGSAITGRCVLTPKPSFEFKARMEQFIADNSDGDAVRALQGIVGEVDKWDLLSQALSGLGTQIASWNPVPMLLPPASALPGRNESYAQLIGAQAQCPPNPKLATPGREVAPSTFEGMRGGQFSFSRLAIVDVFGQTLEIVTNETVKQTSIITGKGLQVTQPVVQVSQAGLGQLPPRLLQPARLNFQFTPPAGTQCPILGWIVPNHLDRGLAAYGADGTLYGELSPAQDTSGQPYVWWWSAPDAPFRTLPDLAAAQPQLGGFLRALEAAGLGALDDFLRSVDETLWTVDPLGNRDDAFTCVLHGRPLAVVSASLSFELQAAAWTDPAWPYTFDRPPPRPLFLNYRFPVQLGDLASREDGLLGYFADGNYATFNAVHIAQPRAGDYLKEIGPGNRINLGFAPAGPGAAGPGPECALTLLMDPRAAVHARAGILPQKDVTLVSEWVDRALAAMKATFRIGPLLAEVRQLTPQGQTTPVASLLTPSPAARRGTWQWRQRQSDGTWSATALGPVESAASLPDAPPILRDGLLQLTDGLDD